MYPTLNIFLGGDDISDCLFFKENITKLKLQVQRTTVNGGEQLMHYLSSSINVPFTVFPNPNMPCKSSFVCIRRLKMFHVLKNFRWLFFLFLMTGKRRIFFIMKMRIVTTASLLIWISLKLWYTGQ